MEACQCSSDAGFETCEVRFEAVGNHICPTNGKQGKLVGTQTVKAMLSLPLTEVQSSQYYFCKEADCPTVYYNISGQTFTEIQLREHVYQKNPDNGSVHVCYCFQHSTDSIRAEMTMSGITTITETITAGIQAGQCACDVRNPQGSFCLGNVNKLVKNLQVEQ